ncbi:MAG: thymidylate synthase [Limisphaerales bacterium]
MNEVKSASLGVTWIHLVKTTLQAGVSINDETLELTGVKVSFSAETQDDPLIRQFGDARMIAEMDKVFFADGANSLGHRYSELMRGPGGRHDLQDVISLLRVEPASKRAVVTLCGLGNGKVPCVNVVQFLVRSRAVHTIYFARGQDVFKKFYADALCLAKMARRVAEALGLPAGGVEGFLGSSHVYHSDRAAIDGLLARAQEFLTREQLEGAVG